MAGGGGMSHGSSSSRSGPTSNLLCSCGKVAVVRTVKSGPNVGFKFHGCPLWLVSVQLHLFFFTFIFISYNFRDLISFFPLNKTIKLLFC
ncbi:DNA topoisomerase 3-alpha [Bienertia sinuspersici]